MVGKCLLCLSEGVKMVKAHIIPRSFFEVAKGAGKYAVGFLIKKESVETPYQQAGPYDEGILGECCEPQFTSWDSYGFEILREQNVTARRALPDAGSHRPGAFQITGLDYDAISLFILSVLWRASVSTHLFFANVDLGPRAEPIRQLLRARQAPDPESYSIMLATTRDEKYRKAVPHPERGRVNGVNLYRIYFPDVFAIIKVDERFFPASWNSVILRRAETNYVFEFPHAHSPYKFHVERVAAALRNRPMVGKGRNGLWDYRAAK